jgi:hypothetical protein
MRFYGVVGYGESKEASEGVYEDEITEVTYRGDVIRDNRRIQESDKLLDDLLVNNSISIVADEYAIVHKFNIKYVEWEGKRWVVSSVESKPPRLILNLGRVYNGPTP